MKEHRDLLIGLPMRGHVASANAAIVGSVTCYEIWRQRGWAMPGEGPVEGGEKRITRSTAGKVVASREGCGWSPGS